MKFSHFQSNLLMKFIRKSLDGFPETRILQTKLQPTSLNCKHFHIKRTKESPIRNNVALYRNFGCVSLFISSFSMTLIDDVFIDKHLVSHRITAEKNSFFIIPRQFEVEWRLETLKLSTKSLLLMRQSQKAEDVLKERPVKWEKDG